MRLTLISIICCLSQIVFGQKTVGVNFEYVEIVEQEWDSIFYNGSLKTNKIDVPDCQLTEVEIKFNDTNKAVLKEEINRQVNWLKSIFAHDGISQKPTVKFTNQTCYRFGTATLAMFEHSIGYEYTKIVTIYLAVFYHHFISSKPYVSKTI